MFIKEDTYKYVKENMGMETYYRVINIASLVTCSPEGVTKLELAEKVEKSIMCLVTELHKDG